MGNSTYSDSDYRARIAYKSAHSIPVFAHHDAIRTGKAKGVHPTLSPRGLKVRESRDSAAHPVAVPIAICNDTTGSMQAIPIVLQAQEPKLMGLLLKDAASGKAYLNGGYPAIMIAACDDYFAIGAEGALQIGQFESDITIDDNLSNLWLTGQGGGNYAESYDLFLYVLARKTQTDHWEKRHRKGHAFIICDEPLFDHVNKDAVEEVIGDRLQADIPIAQIVKEVKERWWLSCIIPNQTSHYNDPVLRSGWKKAIGEQNVLLLDDATRICELIVSTVAVCEGSVSLDDLSADGVADPAVVKALTLLSKSGGLTQHSADKLPEIAGAAGGVERL